MPDKIFSNNFYLTASEVNSQLEMPLSRLVVEIIDTATGHANHLGIGYDKMISHGISWVLSRLTIDIDEMPQVNRSYKMTTWVEKVNRLFSDRNFRLEDSESGRTVLRAHSTWMAIDMNSRRPGDLTPIFAPVGDIIVNEGFGGEEGGKLQPLESASSSYDYTFKVSDIDVNRHVTTRRYIDLMTDLLDLEWYDARTLSRFEIAFKHEAHYSDHATVSGMVSESGSSCLNAQIEVGDTVCCLGRMVFVPRHPENLNPGTEN